MSRIVIPIKRDVTKRYFSDPAFQAALDDWMYRSQGWLPRERRERPQDLERAAKLCAYLLFNKLIFYEGLRRRFELEPLTVPSSIKTASELGEVISQHFEKARTVCGGYGTIFMQDIEERSPLSCDEIVFLSDAAVEPIKELIGRINEFDIPHLPSDVVGLIFKTLTDPRQRSTYGQPYTQPEVVDLINAFCVRSADERVLDPACGGGTFLVRAYARKQFKNPQIPHQRLIDQIYGLDVAPHAVVLSTIGLATCDGRAGITRPCVQRGDFFDVFPNSVLGHGPALADHMDAVMSHPPYVRGDSIEDRGKIHRALLRDARKFGLMAPAISRRSDLYAYFLLHSASFLKDGGYLGFITSDTWLTIDYGIELQKFFLDHFNIIAVIESKLERWFTEAPVHTVVTILQKEPDASVRERNSVKFVRFKVPLSEMFGKIDDASRLRNVESLARSIENTDRTLSDDTMHTHVIPQKELSNEVANWGKYLRAPDVFFEIMDRAKDKICRLKDIADIRRGFTTGANEFFFLKDITDGLTEAQLKAHSLKKIKLRNSVKTISVARASKSEFRVVEDGKGMTHVMEAEYLRAAVKSPRELTHLVIDPCKLKLRLLMVHEDRSSLKGKRVLDYIKYGERQGYHKRPTCAARERWYDLGKAALSDLLVLKGYNDRLMVLENSGVFTSDRLYSCHVREGLDPAVVAAYLNSTVALLMLELYGRKSEREGSLDLMTYEAGSVPVLNPENLDAKLSNHLVGAYRRLASRPVLSIFEEVVMRDRQALDDALLRILDFGRTESAELRDRLYEAVVSMVRSRLESRERGQDQSTLRKIDRCILAADIWRSFDKSKLRAFPDDFIKNGSYEKEVIEIDDGDVKIGSGLFNQGLAYVGDTSYNLNFVSRAEFLKTASEVVGSKAIEVPVDPKVCAQAIEKYKRYSTELEKELTLAAQKRTSDRKMVKRLVNELKYLSSVHLHNS